jgi:hypothetical protein
MAATTLFVLAISTVEGRARPPGPPTPPLIPSKPVLNDASESNSTDFCQIPLRSTSWS